MSLISVTVFTPAYNRAYTIERLYHSLQQQSCMDFEWLVIDDGSSDNTEEIFARWLKENNEFPLRYIKVENGGKHRAINQGVQLANGKLFFIVDSDDYITHDAIKKILSWEKGLPNNFSKFAGVAGARGYSPTSMIGKGSGEEYVDCTSQKRIKYGIDGDKAEAFYTDILKKFPFPTFDGEKFLTESVVWFAIGKASYQLRWYDDIIYIGEYLNDGLSAAGREIFLRNPRGHLLAIKNDLDNLDYNIIQRMGCYAAYYQVGRKLGLTNQKIIQDLNISILTLKAACFLKKIKNFILRK